MVRLDIDLAFSEQERGDADSPPFEGTVTASGTEVRIVVNDPSRLPGNGRRTLTELSTVADALASRGISVKLEGPDGPILQLGDIKSGALQRVITGSKHIRLGSVAAVAPLLVRRNGDRTLTFPVPPRRRFRWCPPSTAPCAAASPPPTTPRGRGDRGSSSRWVTRRGTARGRANSTCCPPRPSSDRATRPTCVCPGSLRCTPRSGTRAMTSTCCTASTSSAEAGRATRAPGATAGAHPAHRRAHRAGRLAAGVLPRRVRRPRSPVRRTAGRRVRASAQAAPARRFGPAQPRERSRLTAFDEVGAGR